MTDPMIVSSMVLRISSLEVWQICFASPLSQRVENDDRWFTFQVQWVKATWNFALGMWELGQI